MACTLYILVNDDSAVDLTSAKVPINQAIRIWSQHLLELHPKLKFKTDWKHISDAKTRIITTARRASGSSPTEPPEGPSSVLLSRARSHTAPAGDVTIPAELKNLFFEAKEDEDSPSEHFKVNIKVVAGTDGEEATNIYAALEAEDKTLIFISSDFQMPKKTGGEFVNKLVSDRGEVPCLIQFRTTNTLDDIKGSLKNRTAKAALGRKILFAAKGNGMIPKVKEAALQALNGYTPKLTALIEAHEKIDLPGAIPPPAKTGPGFASSGGGVGAPKPTIHVPTRRSDSPSTVWATLHSAATAPPDASLRVAPSPTKTVAAPIAPTSTSTTATTISTPAPKETPSNTTRQAEQEHPSYRTPTKLPTTQPPTPVTFMPLTTTLSQTASPPEGSRTVQPKKDPTKPRGRIARLCCLCSGKRNRSKEKDSEVTAG